MGEYARRKADGVEIKIGTCENMYYLRWEDRNAVEQVKYSLDPATTEGLRFRLPYPNEDHILPGEYDGPLEPGVPMVGFDDAELDPGLIQLHHPCGLLMNVPCHHGQKLPEVEGARCGWNGKLPHFIELVWVKYLDGALWPVFQCKACGEMWRGDDWQPILDAIKDPVLRERLEAYALVGTEQGPVVEPETPEPQEQVELHPATADALQDACRELADAIQGAGAGQLQLF